MKKIIYLAAACAALAACNITDMDKTVPGEGIAFEKGQQVTLTVMAGEKTKANGTLDGSGNVNFKWEAGDVIKVTVGGTSAEFTVSKLIDGGASAEFVGTMPGSGTTFDVQFPYETPTLTTQEYVENGVPHNKVLASKAGCILGTPFTLDPQYAALRLNLCGFEREITQIAVTNTTASETYTLTFPLACPAVQLGLDSESFLIVVPSGTFQIKVHIVSNAISGAVGPTRHYESYGIGTLIATSDLVPNGERTFTAGKILNMPVRSITTIWAPVNCGYEPYVNESQKGYPYGKLYQWGRKYGQGYGKAEDGYEDEDYPGKDGGNQFLINSSTPQTSHPDGASYNGYFYNDNTMTIINWYGGSNPDKLWNINEGTTNPVSKSSYDPCPTGWRVPTLYEMKGLLGDTAGGVSGWDDTYKGYWFNGSASPAINSGIFFPAAGCINLYKGNGCDHGETGGYWTSTRDGDSAWYLTFLGPASAGSGIMTVDELSYGFSVRCVENESNN